MLTTIALIDNSPKNWRKFYGGMIRDAMIEYAEFTKNYSTSGEKSGEKSGNKNGQLKGCPMVNRKAGFI
ncbi:hypothetical protein [Serratia marcescens]|uniref:hypothetical protein n=1 Tax=Serratia marcescens TaxID=615 RepID=UPI0011AF4D0B|nr:hypothetical protein [Serratia marcescens]HEJ1072004.1 hypothetical protein [Serratia marcescens]